MVSTDCLSRLNAALDCLSGAQEESSLADMLRRLSVPCISGPASSAILSQLSLAEQIDLLLMLRGAAPHALLTGTAEAVLQAYQHSTYRDDSTELGSGLGTEMLQALLWELQQQGEQEPTEPPPVPSCPTFLFNPQPCFPWTPKLCTAAELAAEEQATVATGRQLGRQETAPAGLPATPSEGARTCKRSLGATDTGSEQQQQQDQQQGKRQHLDSEHDNAGMSAAGLAALKAALQGSLPLRLGQESREALHTLLAQAAAGAESQQLEQAGLASLSDDLLLSLATEALGPAASYARCCAFGKTLVLPRLQSLQGFAPRDLSAVLEHVGAANPSALLDACIQPLLAASGLSKQQGELVGRTVKAALPEQLLPDVLAAACTAASDGSAGGTQWTEATLGVLQALVNARPALSEGTVRQLVWAVHVAAIAGHLQGSVKLAKFLLSVVKQYARQLKEHKAQLQEAVQATKSFMTKSLLAAVAKL